VAVVITFGRVRASAQVEQVVAQAQGAALRQHIEAPVPPVEGPATRNTGQPYREPLARLFRGHVTTGYAMIYEEADRHALAEGTRSGPTAST
jgi:hypothetical protein